MSKTTQEEVHPAGEGEWSFPTYGGHVRLVSTDQALTPFGGLVPLAAFLRRTGIVEQLAESCPVRRTSPNALPVYDVVMSFLLTAVCDGRRFAHVQRLREDPALKELFGLRRGVAGEDAIRRLFAGIETEVGARWVEAALSPVWTALPTPLIIDWDSTVQTKYGRQEGAEIGYNPHKRGRRSFHPLLAATGAWWKQLRDGYQRVAEWLAATAPQLPGPPGHPSLSFTFLLPGHTTNCGI